MPWRCRGVWSDVGDAPRVTFSKEFRAKLFCILQSAVNAAGLQVGGTLAPSRTTPVVLVAVTQFSFSDVSGALLLAREMPMRGISVFVSVDRRHALCPVVGWSRQAGTSSA